MFLKVALTRKIHKLVPDFHSCVEEHGAAGFFSEKEGEGLHYEINLDSAQLPSVRSDPKRLKLVVEEHEQYTKADHSFLTPPHRKRVRSTQGSIFFISIDCHYHGYGTQVREKNCNLS